MSTINPILSYESSEWKTRKEIQAAISEGGDAITKVILNDCHAGDAFYTNKDLEVVHGVCTDIHTGDVDTEMRTTVQAVNIFGVHSADMIEIGFNSLGQITSDYEDDWSSHVKVVKVEGRAVIGSAFVGFITVGPLGFAKIFQAAEVGDLEVFGSVILQAKVKRIRLHAGGKILLWTSEVKEDFMTRLICDEGREPITNEQGWICG